MRLWVDALDGSGNKLGSGPVRNVQTATIKRKLDGVGGFSLSLAASDERELDLLQVGRRVVIYGELGGTVRELGRGTINKITIKDGAQGALMLVKGPDALIELKQKSTLPGRAYDDQAVSAVVSSLAGLAGWTATTDAGLGNVTLKFAGESALKALQTLANTLGLHFRAETGQALTFGALGADTGVRLIQRSRAHRDIYSNAQVTLIRSIRQITSSGDVVNWIIPLGKDGLTLEHSTRSSPYTIQTMTGPDGNTIYYLADATSVAHYGQVEKVLSWSEIEALGSTSADLERAANTLYDAAATWLARSATLQQEYSVQFVKAWEQTIRPGDKVRLVYQGMVERVGGTATYISVDELLWVLDVQETLGSEGHVVSVKLGNVDREAQDALQTVANTIERVNVDAVRA